MDILLVVLIGLVFGSFGNVCIYRIPKGLSIFNPARSFCPVCRSTLKWYDNIPLLSYIFLKARCRDCGARISARYPLIEIITAVVFLAVYLKLGGLSFALPFWWLFAWALVVSSAIDIELRIIPDIFTVGLCAAGLLFSPFNGILMPHGISDFFNIKRFIFSLAGALGGLVMGTGVAWFGEKIFKKESFGGADIKLLAAFGAWLGFAGSFWSLFAASFIGSVISVVLIILKKISPQDYVPFGPYLAAGALLAVLVFL